MTVMTWSIRLSPRPRTASTRRSRTRTATNAAATGRPARRPYGSRATTECAGARSSTSNPTGRCSTSSGNLDTPQMIVAPPSSPRDGAIFFPPRYRIVPLRSVERTVGRLVVKATRRLSDGTLDVGTEPSRCIPNRYAPRRLRADGRRGDMRSGGLVWAFAERHICMYRVFVSSAFRYTSIRCILRAIM